MGRVALARGLDGSNAQQVVSGLTVYAAEALQIALDPVGNKLYWSKGHQLWRANLDGTLPQTVYTIPRAVVDADQIGDVAVDTANGRLYLSENRHQRGDLAGYNSGIRNFGRTFKHTLIVSTDLNGQGAAFVAGAGPGCTYDNYYNNVGYGIGAARPTHCLISGTDGFDVESLTVSSGTLYWSAIDNNGVTSGVYGRTPGQAAFTVAPLALPGNTGGLRLGPLPQLYVDALHAVSLSMRLGADIVRGEAGGEFTRFTSFLDSTPAAPGNVRRSSSTLSAMTIIQTAQSVQTDADLAVGITSPALVMVNGDTARYDITLRNDAALAADNTVLSLALPQGASYAGSSVACTAAQP